MSAAEQAVRSWVNGLSGLSEGALPGGAYLQEQASPAAGAYAVLERAPRSSPGLTAEPSAVDNASITARIYAGTIEAAEVAASAYADAVRAITGNPVTMGDALCLVTDNLAGPAYVRAPATSGEEFCFAVSADFVLVQ